MWAENRLRQLEDFLKEAVAARVVPGAVAQVGMAATVIATVSVGAALVTGGTPRSMHRDTIFDLASLTKVTATLPLILRLVEKGHISFADAVSAYIPEFSGGAKDRVTIGHLLAHTGGLLPHREYFRSMSGYEAVIQAAAAEPLIAEPGEEVAYSDLGFMLLGELIQRVGGRSLPDLARTEVFDVLGMPQTCFCPNPGLMSRMAATEVIPGGKAKVGIVHDDNTEAMGGVSGHAGLFSTVDDMGRYLQAWVDPDNEWLSWPARTACTLSRTAGLNGNRGWGWVLRGDGHDTLGDLWPASAATHTGYTGTSVAFDLSSRMWCVLLTNRVHFGRAHDVTAFRRRFHNVVMAGFGL